ncbi:hypothetical protein RhiirA5_424843 [Rhizophagus irregularis]|uniref:Uncharacterized protein n=2 Tax=Rhizophagus irregularis TaxID=588596 RepID=U9SKK3_RHIID|nr:hypothetical protein GLOIN_2v1763020 [Rhizophagus irregularis DAOM 181602=DAOM 197198]PKC02711.1 hypothetical protein RhiirA5_424843 [Rhizophagus irregularis]POG81779.1 hypothetical protein GLOIN_2v1763020 [Rhizophagus irregularis DAOM 181602=DAOM 197198]|eukprot:XP_025188645.1 hypothetical protein GLOIN_2v1763020 [Rhizophagus irregularis DAOM 181602=DAOM 197198]
MEVASDLDYTKDLKIEVDSDSDHTKEDDPDPTETSSRYTDVDKLKIIISIVKLRQLSYS